MVPRAHFDTLSAALEIYEGPCALGRGRVPTCGEARVEEVVLMTFLSHHVTRCAFADLGALCTWIGLDNAVVPALETATGVLANNIRNLGLLPPAVSRAALSAATIEVAPANPVTGTPAVQRHFTPVDAS